MHYYPHHIGDFIRETSRLSDAMNMLYLRLIWQYYETEQPLPNRPEMLAMDTGSDADSVKMILERFFTLDEKSGAWRQKRCDEEIAAFYKRAERSHKAAKARWGNEPPQAAKKAPKTPFTAPAEPKKRPGKRAPADFVVTDEMRAWAGAHAEFVMVDSETDKFKDHTFSTARTDWVATWRNWMRNAQEHAEARSGRGGVSTTQKSFAQQDDDSAREWHKKMSGGILGGDSGHRRIKGGGDA